jgi:hypothetical protein
VAAWMTKLGGANEDLNNEMPAEAVSKDQELLDKC